MQIHSYCLKVCRSEVANPCLQHTLSLMLKCFKILTIACLGDKFSSSFHLLLYFPLFTLCIFYQSYLIIFTTPMFISGRSVIDTSIPHSCPRRNTTSESSLISPTCAERKVCSLCFDLELKQGNVHF